MIPSPYVSIVSGTYNRLTYLQRMVESIRRSIGIGITYEIVLVDGGSTDGSIEWMKDQKDVVLIEQHELLGAVKAFNAGCLKAKGKYVILANDDIEFKYESVQNSIAYMDDHLDTGIGCFNQNRLSSEYTVSKMPAVSDGKKTWCYYGQVCIVPKWLGDKVGWWGDYLHTYGGDNELSCNIIELGFKIDPLEYCCIEDYKVEDDLRGKNNPVDHLQGGHPDSAKWVKKWTRNGILGPDLGSKRLINSPLKREKRMVYAPLYEDQVFPEQLKTKHGLRDALAEKYLVSEINYRRDPDQLYYGVCMLEPEVVLIQYHDPRILTYDFMYKLIDEFPHTKFVSWNGDYNKKNLFSNSYMQVLKLFDLCTFVTANVGREYAEAGIKYDYWQIGFEDYAPDLSLKKHEYDVLFMGNCYSPARQEMGEMLRFHKEWKTGLFGKWPSHVGSDGITQYDFVRGDHLYRSSTVSIGDSQFPEAIGYVSNRLFQALHAGSFYLQQRVVGMEDLLGLQDGVHLVTWNDLSDLEDKLLYWLDPAKNSERESIAKAGKKFIDSNHSFGNRVEELEKMLYSIKK